MCAYIVADASFFILDKKLSGDLVTVPGVEKELKDIGSRMRLQISNARVERPSKEMMKKAREAAMMTGDISVLSETDLELLAKAMELGAPLATDDYALQNVALHMNIEIEPVAQPKIKRRIKRIQRCTACGKAFEGEICPDCGTARKRRG